MIITRSRQGGGGGSSPSYTPVGYGKNALSATARSDYHVTDGGNGTGAGTIRAALSQSNRNIIFDVDTITLAAVEGGELQLNDKTNIVIDGSSRPNGVTWLNQSLRLDRCSYIVIRNIAFRNCVAWWEGAVQLRNSGGSTNNILIDRCSFSEWQWRGIDGDASDVTVQWCFFGEYSNAHVVRDYTYQEPHYPAYFANGAQRISFDHNLFYNNMYRQPLATYDMTPTGVTSPDTTMDVANQLSWNSWNNAYTLQSHEGFGSFVGSRNGSKVNVRQCWFHAVVNTGSNCAILTEQENGATPPGAYISGCKYKNDAGSLATAFPVGSPYSTTGFDIPLEATAEIAAQQVLLYAGRQSRDSIDAAWAANISI